MFEQIKDAFKGIIKLLGIILYIVGFIPYRVGNYLLHIQFSAEIKAQEALFKAAESRLKVIEKIAKRRAPKKKKVVENVANPVVNS